MDLVTRLRRVLPMTHGAAVSVIFLTALIITIAAASYALSLTAIHRAAHNAATPAVCAAAAGYLAPHTPRPAPAPAAPPPVTPPAA